ncbi:hypothetical protein B0H16DRAFT_1505609 [Mycena metata]|uniref:Uncharacterized protein n=1 Tax=Mycena metata TaxID=1033252 RepID=A0AAD7NW42_9AGAR|nr:hypothetical protein B0H16DRAFT_1505609 [Mycena metata]
MAARPLGFSFAGKTILYPGGNIPSHKDALAFCRREETFGIPESITIEFATPKELCVISSLDWQIVMPGETLQVQYRHPERVPFAGLDIPGVLVSRAKLVQGIITRAETECFLQIRGNPGSGKTVLLHLIQQELMKDGKTIAERFDRPWPTNEDERYALYQRIRTLQKESLKTNTRTVILIDEGQASYGDVMLWNSQFKIYAGHPFGPFNIIIACTYGISISPEIMDPRIPYIRLGAKQNIGLRREEDPPGYRAENSDTPLAILFDNEELDELYTLAVSAKILPPIDEELKDAIFRWTGGYIAIVWVIVRMIKAAAGNNTDAYHLNQFMEDHPGHICKALEADAKCQNFLPTQALAVDPTLLPVFSQLLEDGVIQYRYDRLPSAGESACKTGILYMEENCDRPLRITFVFPLQRELAQM